MSNPPQQLQGTTVSALTTDSGIDNLLVDCKGRGDKLTAIDEYFSLSFYRRMFQQQEWKDGLVMQVVR